MLFKYKKTCVKIKHDEQYALDCKLYFLISVSAVRPIYSFLKWNEATTLWFSLILNVLVPVPAPTQLLDYQELYFTELLKLDQCVVMKQ